VADAGMDRLLATVSVGARQAAADLRSARRAGIRRCVETYRRDRDLPKILPVSTIEVPDPEAHRALIAVLKRARRGEFRRCLARHWTADRGLLALLTAALIAELRIYRNDHSNPTGALC